MIVMMVFFFMTEALRHIQNSYYSLIMMVMRNNSMGQQAYVGQHQK